MPSPFAVVIGSHWKVFQAHQGSKASDGSRAKRTVHPRRLSNCRAGGEPVMRELASKTCKLVLAPNVRDSFDAMRQESGANITQLLVAWGKGDQLALEALTPHVQQELHRLAAHYMAGERPGHVPQATALVTEAYLKLVDWKGVEWADRSHFFGIAANMMRHVLVDYARSNARAKRGGGAM